MGQCYIVDWDINYPESNKTSIINTLKNYILTKEAQSTADFNLSKYAAKGFTPDTWTGIMTLLFTDRGTVITDHNVSASFDASYGWESIITEAFETIIPLVDTTSIMRMETDDGTSVYTIKDNKLDCDYTEYEYDEDGEIIET